MYPSVGVTEKEFSWSVAFWNMESLVVFLLLIFLPGFWSLAEIACRIAVKQNVQVTYLYRCTSCPSSFDQELSALELELYRCVGSRLPMVTRNIEAHEVEPLRNTDSLSIFQIPADFILSNRFESYCCSDRSPYLYPWGSGFLRYEDCNPANDRSHP